MKTGVPVVSFKMHAPLPYESIFTPTTGTNMFTKKIISLRTYLSALIAHKYVVCKYPSRSPKTTKFLQIIIFSADSSCL